MNIEICGDAGLWDSYGGSVAVGFNYRGGWRKGN